MATDTTNDEDADLRAGFESEDREVVSAPEPEGKPAETTATQDATGDEAAADGQPAQAGQDTPADADAKTKEPGGDDGADPFAELPPAVRALLAKVPALQSELAESNKRYRELDGLARSLQSRLDKADAQAKAGQSAKRPDPDEPQPTPAKPGRKLEKLERVRETLGADLPEVMDALDEIAGLIPDREQPRQAAPSEPQPKEVDDQPTRGTTAATSQGVDPVVTAHLSTLDELRPGWFEALESDDARLWLAANRDRAAQYAQADTPAKLIKVLDAFEAHRQTSKQARLSAATSQARRAAGVTPSGPSRTPPRPRAMSEDEAMNQGFYS